MVSTDREGIYTAGAFDGYSRLEIIRHSRARAGGPLGTANVKERDETLATFELRYLSDTHEVALMRWDPETEEFEAVYSELLDDNGKDV